MEKSEKEKVGLVFKIQKFSTEDGPGIRSTIFMKGCSLRCPWCSNPESISTTQQLMPSARNCIACKQCDESCPTGAISFQNESRVIDLSLCTNCLACAKVCPSGALEVAGEYKTVAEAFDIVERDKDFYRNSGGGVTVSGGEAMLQWKFVRDLFKECQKAGFHTALDTTGCCSWDKLEQVLQYTDLVLYDVKHTDSAIHKASTGVPNEQILSNLEKAVKMTEVWMRVPVIPGFNDSEDNMRKTAELAASVGVEKVSLLPYHDLASEKYNRLGMCFDGHIEKEGEESNKQAVGYWKDILESQGLSVGIGN